MGIKKYNATIQNGHLGLEESVTGELCCDILSLQKVLAYKSKYYDFIFTAYEYEPSRHLDKICTSNLIITTNFNEYKDKVGVLKSSKCNIMLSIFALDGTHIFTMVTNENKDTKIIADNQTIDTLQDLVADVRHIIE